MQISLKGKAAFITGASRGIGRACAVALAQAGAHVALAATRADLLQEVRAEAEKAGVRSIIFPLDVTQSSQVDSAVEQTAKEFGSLDILVNNAGITRDNLILRMKEEEWTKVIDTNLKGAFYCLRAASKVMFRQRCGRIINISSVGGLTGNAGQANYAASKAGMIGMTRSAAQELGSRGVTVNAIAPGFVETDMIAHIQENTKARALEQIPLRRLGKPDDVANLAVFLSSEQASYITGAVIVVDGGLTMLG